MTLLRRPGALAEVREEGRLAAEHGRAGGGPDCAGYEGVEIGDIDLSGGQMGWRLEVPVSDVVRRSAPRARVLGGLDDGVAVIVQGVAEYVEGAVARVRRGSQRRARC